MTINASTGQITWQPQANQNHFGLNNVKIIVSDPIGDKDSIRYVVLVLDDNSSVAVPEFSKALYLGYNDQARVFIRDDDFVGSLTAVDSFAVQVYSTADPVGFSTYATEIGLKANEFLVNFGFDSLRTNNGKIKANVGDTIWIAFVDASTRTRVVDFSYFTKVRADFEQIPFICSGDSFRFKNLSTGSGFKYEWDFSDGVQSDQKHPMHTFERIYGGNPRIFDVKLKITDYDGTTSTVSKPITIIPLPIATFGDTVQACNTAVLDAGNPNGQYVWSNGLRTQTITLDSSQKIKVKITNSYGCVNTDSTDLTIWKLKTQIAGVTSATCEGNDGAITLNTEGGTNNYNYRWSDSLRTTLNTANVSAGNYVVTVTDSITNCTIKQNVTVPLINNLVVDSIQTFDLKCFEDNNGVLVVKATGPNTINYQWNNGISIKTINNLTRNRYTVIVTTKGGCKEIKTGVVASPPKLLVDTIKVTAIACVPQSGNAEAIMTGGVAPYTYIWSNNQPTKTINNLVNGDYFVTVNDAHNCKVIKKVTLNQVMPTMSALVSKVDVRCFEQGDGSIKVDTVTGGWGVPYTYTLESGNNQPVNSFSGLSGGNYVVHIKDKKGCEITRNVNVYEPPRMVVDINAPEKLDLGDSSQLYPVINVSDPIKWEWKPKDGLDCTNCRNPVAKPLGTTSYVVAATDRNGCIAKDTLKITVANKRKVFIPTAFSPNNDGNNDVFMVYGGNEVRKINKFQVYNRWGNRVFGIENVLPNDPSKGWDGLFQGQVAEMGSIFIYAVEVEYINGKIEVFSGDVTIVR